MRAINFLEGTIYYWQKTLAAYITENSLNPMAILPRIVEVNDDQRLVLDLKARYTVKGQEFVETTSFWSNRVLKGDEIEAMKDLGTLDSKQCILHFGIYFPKGTDQAILDACAKCQVPSDFGAALEGLTEAQIAVVAQALAKTKGWKIDTISDGVKSITPSGERAKFEA